LRCAGGAGGAGCERARSGALLQICTPTQCTSKRADVSTQRQQLGTCKEATGSYQLQFCAAPTPVRCASQNDATNC
jgi:hypothetical protein